MEKSEHDAENQPAKTDVVKMYVCGPTPYDKSHVGHARVYTTVDMINRVMTNIFDEKTLLVMNITDIDDKIIKKATETNVNWKNIAKMYEDSFFASMSKLNVQLPNLIIRVTECLPEIVKYIQQIIDNNFAYMTPDGSVYFDTIAYAEAGYKVQNMDDEEFQTQVSVEILLQKKNKKDFALWKGRNENEVGFDVEFRCPLAGLRNQNSVIKSHGRPGWHIECSTMIHETIGPDIDIHFGGIDLKFPHHNNEIIQANAFYHPLFSKNKKWVNRFMHVGHLCVAGLKMAKSLKNFTTIDEALKTITPNQLRWMFATHQWQEQLDFSDETVIHATAYDLMIKNFFNRIVNYPFDINHTKYNQNEKVMDEYFYETCDNIKNELKSFEFANTSKLLSELITRTNKYISNDVPNKSIVLKIYGWIQWLVHTLGFDYSTNIDGTKTKDVMNVLVNSRSSLRSLVRDKSVPKEVKMKLFQILDNERDVGLKNIGVILQDTPDSSSWYIDA